MFNQEWQNLRLLFKYSIKRATKTINQPLLLKTDLSPSLFIYNIVLLQFIYCFADFSEDTFHSTQAVDVLVFLFVLVPVDQRRCL